MMSLMPTVERVFDVVMVPLSRLGPAWAMAVLSLAAGFLMVGVYSVASNQAGIRRVKNRMKGHFLELRLFRDDLHAVLRAQRRILRHNLSYMGYALKPLAVMIIPILLLLSQMNGWFAERPLRPGETSIVTAELARWDAAAARSLVLEAPEGIRVETPGVCIPERNEVVWRIRADAPGLHEVRITGDAGECVALVAVGNAMARTTPVRASGESLIKSARIDYEPTKTPCLWWRTNWLVLFFVESIVFGLMARRVFHVDI